MSSWVCLVKKTRSVPGLLWPLVLTAFHTIFQDGPWALRGAGMIQMYHLWPNIHFVSVLGPILNFCTNWCLLHKKLLWWGTSKSGINLWVLENSLILCSFGKIIVDLTLGNERLPNHWFLARFQYQSCIFFSGVELKFIQNKHGYLHNIGATIAHKGISHSVRMLATDVAHRVHSQQSS